VILQLFNFQHCSFAALQHYSIAALQLCSFTALQLYSFGISALFFEPSISLKNLGQKKSLTVQTLASVYTVRLSFWHFSFLFRTFHFLKKIWAKKKASPCRR
jgi:hypothetical protein